MWFGTYGSTDPLASFVEVGVYDGAWTDGTLYHGFFSGRVRNDGSWNLHRFTGLPATVGHYVKVEAFKTSSGYVRAYITDETTFDVAYKTWDDSSGPYTEWQVGEEFTCPTTGQIDATYVYDNEYRRSSDDIWTGPESGTIEHEPPTLNFGTLNWCYQPLTFDYWLNGSNPNCS